jgi:hypothetical protein
LATTWTFLKNLKKNTGSNVGAGSTW